MARRRPSQSPRVEVEVTNRDYLMARLAAGRSALADADQALANAIALCVNPDEDPKGKTRKEDVTTALEAIGVATRSVESAEAMIRQVDFTEVEPWEDDEAWDDDDADDDLEDDDDDDDDDDHEER